jgi:hypothetical protein
MGSGEWGVGKRREHLTFAAKQARNLSFEAEGRRKKERGRRKEPEEVFLQI